MNRATTTATATAQSASRKRTLRRAAATVLATVALGAHAATLTGSLSASITLQSSCLVVGAPGATTGINLGTLDFGSWPATFTGAMNATPSGGVSGTITQLLCSPDVAGVSLTINGGQHAGQGGNTVGAGTRAMRGVSGNGIVAYLPYEIYSDIAYANPFPVGTAVAGLAIPATGLAIALPVFARVNKAANSSALPAATYSDTLVVTLNY
ncbi:fimbrial major subunit CsuA/B family protein [Xylophilus sp. Kf1]|nr:fimbrial major subunit CsuA/B family protein [Xylophilus sp. Kf1]